MRYVCIHGHFYQPPRENPWLNEIERQDSAAPYHDWNERINAECYARNTASRILNEKRQIRSIVNNLTRMSFNFGPTLLSWMERKAPDVYQAVIEADRLSQDFYKGHGNALAQVYNHIIMPLADTKDKETQIVWGITDFRRRFGRDPEGMWLAETAVDLETLDIMAAHGIRFTILAPRQASAVRPLKQHKEEPWQDVSNGRIDPRRVYLCRLPSGRTIHLFFYDGPVSQAVAFEGLLINGEQFAQRLVSLLDDSPKEPQLAHIATDGETYGHHHRFGDMALAYCLDRLQQRDDVTLINYGAYLTNHPPEWEVRIIENSSWSCVHGVERWRNDCGCNSGMHPGWHQRWRKPLREALDDLRDKSRGLYAERMPRFCSDPWLVRNRYIDVIHERSEDCYRAFFQETVGRDITHEQELQEFIKLLEMQHNALLMYTSCGWFFDEISGLETVQILKYAARVIQLAQSLSGADWETPFLEKLKAAPSNLAHYNNGEGVYRQCVKPAVVDLQRVAAHYSVAALFQHYPSMSRIYAYDVARSQDVYKEMGRMRCFIARIKITSRLTLESQDLQAAVVSLGDHNIIAGVCPWTDEAVYNQMQQGLLDVFNTANLPEIIKVVHHYFDDQTYSLWHLFRDEQYVVVNEVLKTTEDEIESSFRQIFEHHYPLLRLKETLHIVLPKALTAVVEYVLNRDLLDELQSPHIDLLRIRSLVDHMKEWGFSRERTLVAYTASQRLTHLASALALEPERIDLLTTITELLQQCQILELDLDLWKLQNIIYALSRDVYPKRRSLQTPVDRDWCAVFEKLMNLAWIEPPSV